jgi:hypothetical protein
VAEKVPNKYYSKWEGEKLKKIILILITFSLLVNLLGCTNKSTEQFSEQKKQDIQEFKSIFSNFAKEENIIMSSKEMDAFHDITPENVFKETGCQIFKNGSTCESYLLCEGNLYTLGIGFGGFGIVHIETCDFDDDNKKDLIYTYSWGSGIHRSSFGYFDLSKKSEGEIDIDSAELSGFIQEELVLEKVSDTQFQVYKANVTIEGGDFTKLSLKKDRLLGEIKAVEKKPVLFIK